MKKKHASRRHSTPVRRTLPRSEKYLIVVRSWMIVVMFALMLGVGAVLGQFFNDKLSETTPSVAGVQIEVR